MSLKEELDSLETQRGLTEFDHLFYEAREAEAPENAEREKSFRDSYPALSRVIDYSEHVFQEVLPGYTPEERKHLRTGMLLGFMAVDHVASADEKLSLQRKLHELNPDHLVGAFDWVIERAINIESGRNKDLDDYVWEQSRALGGILDHAYNTFDMHLVHHSEMQRASLRTGMALAFMLLHEESEVRDRQAEEGEII